MSLLLQVAGRVLIAAGAYLITTTAIDAIETAVTTRRIKKRALELEQLKNTCRDSLTNLELEIGLKRSEWYQLTFDEQRAFKAELTARYVSKLGYPKGELKSIVIAYVSCVESMLNEVFID